MDNQQVLYRPFVNHQTSNEYRQHFERTYCDPTTPISTFDGITVDFWPSDFDHAFFKGPGKGRFSLERAKRIDWIGEALADGQAKLYIGWDGQRREYRANRRVCLVGGNYVVVIQVRRRQTRARFVTAFISDPWIVPMIQGSPQWELP